MMQLVLIGICAGFAAALLYASLAGGTSLAFPLFCATGVPIAIVGFGWSPLGGAIAALAGAAALLLVMLPDNAIGFLLLFAAPVAWCVRLAMLSRTNEDGETEWYPYGRLLLHATAAVAIGVTLIGVLSGYSVDTLTPPFVDAMQAWFAGHAEMQPVPSREEMEGFVAVLLQMLPYAFGATALFMVVVDLWIGAFVARKSGRLARPSAPAWSVALPLEAVLAFAVVLALSFAPPPLGEVAAVATGALTGALALVGLAAFHALTIGNSARPMLLFGTYFLIVLFTLPIFLFAILGIAETLFQLRARRFRGSPPSA